MNTERGAIISDCGRYRYHLWRTISAYDRLVEVARASLGSARRCAFVMVNPSTADADLDDATIRKCLGFSGRWGFEMLDVVNLYAWRARDPKELRKADALAMGPDNDGHIARVVERADRVVLAWGGHGTDVRRTRPDEVTTLVRRAARGEVGHLGLTNDAQPKHPLMLAYNTPFRKTG